MYQESEEDRVLMIRELRNEINNGKGIARIQAIKLMWEMMGKPTAKPEEVEDEKPITFLIAGPLNDDEIPSHPGPAKDTPTPSED
jgi:hypothetical protein